MRQQPSDDTSAWIDSERPHLAGVVYRNLRLMKEMRERSEREQRADGHVADTITRFMGSLPFVYLHAGLLGLWISVNLMIPRPWDPFPFVMLAMIASVESIFLSTFILIRQNRIAKLTERRSELDLQISLLTEHEVTRLLSMVDAMAIHFKIPVQGVGDVAELKKDVSHEKLLEEIAKSQPEPPSGA